MKKSTEQDLHGAIEKRDSDKIIRKWLSEKGVFVLGAVSGNESTNPQWLRVIGVLNSSDKYISSEIATQRFLGNNANFGEGWFRGGGESFYKICKINYESNGQLLEKFIAFKAINSMGNILNKVRTEVVWMAQVSSLGLCSKVFAMGDGIFIKEFLIQDPPEMMMSKEQYLLEMSLIAQMLTNLGMKPRLHFSGKIQVEVIQHNGVLMLIDLGSGDILGPDPLTFIQNLK